MCFRSIFMQSRTIAFFTPHNLTFFLGVIPSFWNRATFSKFISIVTSPSIYT
ncbi:hypothetical protein BDF21DRAFT_412730 [Thamnidium elegans]|nr:hypothetical protein BDF21DRAFT_412730 [Thamnidium elegans]